MQNHTGELHVINHDTCLHLNDQSPVFALRRSCVVILRTYNVSYMSFMFTDKICGHIRKGNAQAMDLIISEPSDVYYRTIVFPISKKSIP